MNVRLLIQNAYRWAEIVAETGEYVSSVQLETGLNLFNKIIRRESINGHLIPLETKETFSIPQGTREYQLDGWTKLEKVQFNLGDVLIDVKMLSLNDYRNNSRITNSSGIPYICYPRRNLSGIALEIFFSLGATYDFTIDGFKSLVELELEDELQGVDKFMQDYIEIRLAINLQQFYQLVPNVELMGLLREYKVAFKDIKSVRIDVNTHNNDSSDFPYSQTAQLSIGRGWSP